MLLEIRNVTNLIKHFTAWWSLTEFLGFIGLGNFFGFAVPANLDFVSFDHKYYRIVNCYLKCVYFYLLFGCPTSYSAPMLRGQPRLSHVNHCLCYLLRPKGQQESDHEVGCLCLAKNVEFDLPILL